MGTDVNIQAGQAPDVEWVDAQYPFDGEWIPDVDPSLIGPRNFANILNLRYNDKSIEGVNGYTLINDTPLGELKLRDGFQLRTNKTSKSYVLVSATDDINPGKVYINTNALETDRDWETHL